MRRPPTSTQLAQRGRVMASPGLSAGPSLTGAIFEGRDVQGRIFYGRGFGSVPNSYEITAPIDWTGIRVGTEPTIDRSLEPHFISYFAHGNLGAVMTDITDMPPGMQPHPHLFTFVPTVGDSAGVFDGAPYGQLGLPGARGWMLYANGIDLRGPFYDKNNFTGNGGQVLSSLGGTDGVDWVDLPTIPTPGVPDGWYQAVIQTSGVGVSSTTFVNAGALKLVVTANAIWTFEFFLIVDINSSSDFKLRFTVPSGAGGGFLVFGMPVSNTMTAGNNSGGGGSFSAEPMFGVSASSQYLLNGRGIMVCGATPGDMQLQIGLNSGTNTATVLTGSYISGLRVA